jgi:Uma2 family endonuclease
MAVETAKRYITVDEYYQMAEVGILSEDERVELVEGEITTMSPIGRRHAGCVNRLTNLLAQMLGQKAIVAVQNPVRLSIYSEPEPDVALLQPRGDFYSNSHPGPADVLLIVEVADTSIGYDRKTKVPLYARAGIPEVWLVDLAEETVTQYVQPIKGAYQRNQQVKRGERITSNTLKSMTLTVDEILGTETATRATAKPE